MPTVREQNSVSVIESKFRRGRGTWFVKTHFSGALLSIGMANASPTRFQTPKLHHANAPNGTRLGMHAYDAILG